MKSIGRKILLWFLITGTLFVVLSGAYNIYNLIHLNKEETSEVKKILYDDYDKMIKNEVDTATFVVNTYYLSYKDGKMSEAAAKEAAKAAIKNLRYDKDGYFWIDDTNGILVAHPIQPEQEGTNRIGIKDPNGVYIIKNIIKMIENNGAGYTNFMWEKPVNAGTNKLSPKRAYSKIFKPWNWIVSTGNYVDNINAVVQEKQAKLNKNLFKSTVASGLFVLISFIVIIFVGLKLSKNISVPVIRLMKAFEKDENGQIQIQEIKNISKDEIGRLSHTLNELSEQIGSFVQGVITQAENVTDSSKQMDEATAFLDKMVKDISETTENLSSGMEETASACEEMNATAVEIVNSMESIAEKADKAVKSSREISERAGELKTNFNDTVENGNKKIGKIRENLNSALEQSKSVTQINELAVDILDITSQTNLLALNASIEASHAGEAGAGFAVVAKNIRDLAENSRDTAEKIQSIIKTVVDSVNNLSENSSELLKFINTDVHQDYSLMLKASDEYESNAKNIEMLITDFNTITQKLNVSMQDMMTTIDAITQSTTKGAEGTEKISLNTITVKDNTSRLLSQAETVKGYSDNLLKLVLKFKL